MLAFSDGNESRCCSIFLTLWHTTCDKMSNSKMAPSSYFCSWLSTSSSQASIFKFYIFPNLISLGLPSYISNKYYGEILDGVPMVRGFFVVTISENIMVLCSQSITLLLLFSVIVTLNTIKQSFSWFNKLNYIFYKDNVLWQTWTFDIHIRYIYILSNTSTVEWKSLD